MKMSNPVALRKPPKLNWKGVWRWDRCPGSSATQERSPSTSPCRSWAWAMPRRGKGQRLHKGRANIRGKRAARHMPGTKSHSSKKLHSSLKWEKDMVCARNGKSCNRLHQSVSSTPRCEETHFLRVLANVYWSAFQNVSWFLLLPEALFFPSSGLFVLVGVFHRGREW